MKSVVAFDFAVNDPDNGIFAGSAAVAYFGEAELEAPGLQEFRFTELEQAIRIHRHVFTIVEARHWVGNWCWNRYFLKRADAKRLIRLLRDKGWRCTCGPARFYDWMNGVAA